MSQKINTIIDLFRNELCHTRADHAQRSFLGNVSLTLFSRFFLALFQLALLPRRPFKMIVIKGILRKEEEEEEEEEEYRSYQYVLKTSHIIIT